MMVLLVGILVAVAVILGLVAIGGALEPVGEVEERIEDWVQSGRKRRQDREAAGGSPVVLLGRVERSIARRSFAENAKAELARADLSLTVTEYLLIRILVVAGSFVFGYLLRHNLLAGLLLAVVGFFLPAMYVRRRQGQRLTAFNRQLPDVLDHLVGSLRAGYGLLQAVEWVARQMPHPAGSEFDRVIREVQLGRTLPEALSNMVRRIDSDDLALIITAIKIQHEVGGGLADILDVVAHTIRERVRITREISVLTSQQRFSGYVLMLLPLVLGIVLFLLSPDYMMQLFTPGPTLCIPIGTAIMMTVGFFAMRRIIDIEV